MPRESQDYGEKRPRTLKLANLLTDAGLLTRSEAKQGLVDGTYHTFQTTPQYARDFIGASGAARADACFTNYRAEKVNKLSVDGDIATVTTISKDDGTTPWNQNAALMQALGLPAVKTDVIQVFTLVKSGDAWNVQLVQNQ